VLGVVLVLSAVVFPWWFGPVHINDTLEFNDSQGLPVATVWGNVHVSLVGTWTASAPTWQTSYSSGVSAPPACWPRCGNASESGSVNWSTDLCVELAGGGTNYGWGPTLTLYLLFAAEPNSPDTVQTHLTLVVTASSSCG
jgi:hypothetical protein